MTVKNEFSRRRPVTASAIFFDRVVYAYFPIVALIAGLILLAG